jgi:PAS domain S-box-containing protein
MSPSRSSPHERLGQRSKTGNRKLSSAQLSAGRRKTESNVQLPTDMIRLEEFVEQSPEAVAVLDVEGRVLCISSQFSRMFGYAPSDALGYSIYDLIIPERLVDSARELSARLHRGARIELETARRRKDGTEIDVSLVAVPLSTAAGARVAHYTLYHDITERKRADERLVESEARFRAIADAAPVMIWTTGTDGFCDYFSKPWLEFTGRTMEQEVGTGWVEGVHPDDVKTCFDSYWPNFHGRRPFRMDYRLRRADGEYRWVIESGIPRYTGAGEFAGYIGANIDITDLRRAEEERERLRQVQAELAHLNRLATMGELTASLAHEINQPIASALISARACVLWLNKEVPDLEEARAAASQMIAEAERTSAIVDRVRSLYRRGSLQREPVDVNSTIRDMVVLLDKTAAKNSVSIRTALKAALPPALADRVQLQQVLMNLMLNGIESMKDTGGQLSISSRATEDGQLSIAVTDSGIGLPAGADERIFAAFFTTKPQGTGMGLAITRSIIESHGGRLGAKANEGPGATFQFTLPQAPTSN